MAIASINPATGEKLKEFSPFDDAEIEKRLSRAEQAFKRYRRTTLPERAELLHDVSELLFQEKQTFAEIITSEMGKLFRDSVAEIERSEEHTSELQSPDHLVCRLLLEKKKMTRITPIVIHELYTLLRGNTPYQT